MPRWVIRELNSLVFKFSWKGKRELVARRVVVQDLRFGGFSVVSAQFKVWAVLVQWVRHLATASPIWARFFEYHTGGFLSSSPLDALSRPSVFDPGDLLPFYHDLVLAWKAVEGGFSDARASLVVGLSTGLVLTPAAQISTKFVYSLLLSEHLADPHCVTKFARDFGPLYWSVTWEQLFWFGNDSPIIDLSWKIAHGCCIPLSALPPLVTLFPMIVFAARS